MSIETAASDLAAEILRHDFVEVLCHHDADGIAAGAIMATALFRAHIPFRLRVTHRLTENNLPKTPHLLLCDLGAGVQSMPENTMVIDHHYPVFKGSHHVNPRLEGIDGDKDLSGAGTAYLVASALGDNRDLAGLVLLGVIGDGQDLSGKNQEIYHEGIANGIVAKHRGMQLFGRTRAEKLLLSINPFFPGISGKPDGVNAVLAESTIQIQTVEEEIAEDILCSLLTFAAAPICTSNALTSLWGDLWKLEREVVEDAFTLAMLVDTCGKSGAGSIATEICLRSASELETAWNIAKTHRLSVIAELERFIATERTGKIRIFETDNRYILSDLADAIYHSLEGEGPVMTITKRENGLCHCSIRGSLADGVPLAGFVSEIAEFAGGYGGGHMTRAGATVPCDNLKQFLTGFTERCCV